MDGRHMLEEALDVLGALLDERDLTFDYVIIGGGALLLADLLDRPTADVDVVARVHGRELRDPRPFPPGLVQAIREVGEARGLGVGRGRDWLNPGPAILTRVGLPDGFEAGLTRRTFGGLTIRVPARADLIALKLWAATDIRRGARRQVDIADLRQLEPTREDILRALRWCKRLDGRADFFEVDARPVLDRLEVDVEPGDV